MKKIIKLLLVLTMFFSMSVTCFAAPITSATGETIDSNLPADFTSGYTYADFNTFNSYASENGLGGTFIWLEGTFSSIIESETDNGTLLSAYVTDVNGNQWLIMLDYKTYTKDFSAIYNKSIAIAARYQGFSNVAQMPAAFAVKICDISTGAIWNSVYGTITYYNDMPDTSSYKLTLYNKNLYAARYYVSADGESIYADDIYYDVQVRPTYIKYEFVLAGVTTMSGYAYKLSTSEGCYWDSKFSNNIYLGRDNVLIAGQGLNNGLFSSRVFVSP